MNKSAIENKNDTNITAIEAVSSIEIFVDSLGGRKYGNLQHGENDILDYRILDPATSEYLNLTDFTDWEEFKEKVRTGALKVGTKKKVKAIGYYWKLGKKNEKTIVELYCILPLKDGEYRRVRFHVNDRIILVDLAKIITRCEEGVLTPLLDMEVEVRSFIPEEKKEEVPFYIITDIKSEFIKDISEIMTDPVGVLNISKSSKSPTTKTSTKPTTTTITKTTKTK